MMNLKARFHCELLTDLINGDLQLIKTSNMSNNFNFKKTIYSLVSKL